MLQLNFNPFPTIETERSLLRRITTEDSEDFFYLRTNEEAMKYIDRPRPKSIKESNDLIVKMDDGIQQNTAIGWGISLKDKPGLIGTISYHNIYTEHYRAEIGYMLSPAYWGTGIMSEAIKVVLDFGFNQMGLHSIEANVNPLNNVSKYLLKKFSFNQEAYFKQNYYFDGKFLDSEIYSLVKG